MRPQQIWEFLSNTRIIYFKGTLDVRVWNTHNKKIHFHCYFFNIKDVVLSVLCVKWGNGLRDNKICLKPDSH